MKERDSENNQNGVNEDVLSEQDSIEPVSDTTPEMDALDAALEGDENVDLRALVFELFESFGSVIGTDD